MATPIHSRIINKVARKIFKEHGIERKGQSRTWLDDQYWYTTVIEFQPFKDSHGTCLNVGANFHWYKKEYFSFDLGGRVSEFIEFKNEGQFENEVNSLVRLALKETLMIRENLSNLKSAEKTIMNHQFSSDNLWGNYHRAIINGLNNKIDESGHYFNLILGDSEDVGWAIELKSRVHKLKTVFNDNNYFKRSIEEIIKQARMDKKLNPMETKGLW
ncbi:MAG: hypothetical protein WBG90_03055 [Saonia sp.]